MITTIFIDVDNTLLDFHKCAKSSMKKAFSDINIKFNESIFNTFNEINNSLWNKIEKGQLTREKLYKIRWNLIFECLNIDYDGEKFETAFRGYLSKSAEPVTYAKELLIYLDKKYKIYVISNAAHEQQVNRLKSAGMLQYIDAIFTSENLGYSKPDTKFFDECFKRLENVSPSEVIIIGDSLTADIQGGVSYNIKTCWYNHDAQQQDDKIKPTYIVNSLKDIENIL